MLGNGAGTGMVSLTCSHAGGPGHSQPETKCGQWKEVEPLDPGILGLLLAT